VAHAGHCITKFKTDNYVCVSRVILAFYIYLYSIIFLSSNLNKTLIVLTENLICFEYQLNNPESLNSNMRIIRTNDKNYNNMLNDK
jgi:hypothetical protein